MSDVVNKIDEFSEFDEAFVEDGDHIAMRDVDAESRPREKLVREGASQLTRAELLAILIGSGSREKNAEELMSEILADCGGRLMLLDRMSIEELMSYKGIGEAKAITIKAAMELSNRRVKETMTDSKAFSSADVTYQFMYERLKNLSHEECWALMLNNSARLLKAAKVSQGGRTGTVVDTRIVLKKAILAEATCVILVHNHPSGSLRPSRDDDNLTRSVKDALSMIDMRLLDHVIIADGGYYSYSEMGKI